MIGRFGRKAKHQRVGPVAPAGTAGGAGAGDAAVGDLSHDDIRGAEGAFVGGGMVIRIGTQIRDPGALKNGTDGHVIAVGFEPLVDHIVAKGAGCMLWRKRWGHPNRVCVETPDC